MQSNGFAGYDPARTYAVQVSDVEYLQVDGESLLARIYRPQGAGPFPALIDVHGGAWCSGDRLNNAHMSQALAATGLVIVAVDFRLAPAYAYPASMADVNYGIRWLKAHAHEFGADPRHVGGFGGSSGGHMVMLAAMRPHDPRYAAHPLAEEQDVDASLAYVVVPWPIMDPYARSQYAKDVGRPELANRTEQYFGTEERMQEGNPQRILDRGERVPLPPALILQGTADTNLTMEMTERFVASYRAAGGTIELEKFPDQPHNFGNTPGPDADRALALIKAFVARQLGAPAAVR
jgi:acetyl esterase